MLFEFGFSIFEKEPFECWVSHSVGMLFERVVSEAGIGTAAGSHQLAKNLRALDLVLEVFLALNDHNMLEEAVKEVDDFIDEENGMDSEVDVLE